MCFMGNNIGDNEGYELCNLYENRCSEGFIIFQRDFFPFGRLGPSYLTKFKILDPAWREFLDGLGLFSEGVSLLTGAVYPFPFVSTLTRKRFSPSYRGCTPFGYFEYKAISKGLALGSLSRAHPRASQVVGLLGCTKT
jgi:hypothetical protein